jgi:hypothetical protein
MDRAHFVENLQRDDINILGDRDTRQLLGIGRPNG